MSSNHSPSNRGFRRATSSETIFPGLFAAVPPRVIGHAAVVLLCVVVAYAGRTNRLSDQLGNAAISTTPFQTAALTSPQTRGVDTLVRPSLPTTQVGTQEYLQLIHYEAQAGDTVANLVDRYSISDSTIRWANQLSANSELQPGQVLVVPPVSGVVYTVQTGDTVSSIAQCFQSDAAAIAQFNPLPDSEPLTPGTQLIIPGGRLEDVNRPELTSWSRARPRLSEAAAQTGTSSAPLLELPGNSAGPDIVDRLGEDGSLRVPFSGSTAPPPLAPVIYQVTPGDTLWSVSQKFGVSADSILLASGLAGSEDSLKIDQKLLIPPVPGVIHVVQDGDTLQAIAQRYGADEAQTAKANGLVDPYPLKVGQTLVVPGGMVPATPPATQTTYVVRDGDTITSIGSTFGIDPQAVVSANGLTNPDVLQPGQQVVIPAPGYVPPSTPTPLQTHTTYKVQEDDSVLDIAQKFGADFRTLINANGLSAPYVLQLGQQIVVPGAARAAPAVGSTNAAVVEAPAPRGFVSTPSPMPKLETPTPAPRPASNDGWTIVGVESKYLGKPYVWGGTSPVGFGCSGFIWYVYRHASYPVPRDLWGQLQSGSRVSRGNLQPGDIVFFADTYQPGLSHGAIYLGGGRVISASDYGVGVAVISLANPYWSSRYFGATRPW